MFMIIFRAVIGLVNIAFGIAAITIGVGVLARYEATANWVPANATFDKVEVVTSYTTRHEHGKAIVDTLYLVHAEYRYDYQDNHYSGHAFTLGKKYVSTRSRSEADTLAERVKVDGRVWVNPANPAQSIVSREDTLSLLFVFAIGAGVMAVAWWVGAFGNILSRFIHKRSLSSELRDLNIVYIPRATPHLICAIVVNGFLVIASLLFVPTWMTPDWQAVVWCVFNVLAQYAAFRYRRKIRQRLSAKVHFNVTPADGAPVDCAVRMAEMKRTLSASIRIVRKTDGGSEWVVAEYPMTVSEMGAGEYHCILTTDESHGITFGAGGFYGTLPDYMERMADDGSQESDNQIRVCAAFALLGRKPPDPTWSAAIEAVDDKTVTRDKIIAEFALRSGMHEASAPLLKDFWRGSDNNAPSAK